MNNGISMFHTSNDHERDSILCMLIFFILGINIIKVKKNYMEMYNFYFYF